MIDLYSEKDYNNFGWVRVNDVLNPYQWNRVKTNYADAVTNKMHFPKKKTGDLMIPVYNEDDTIAGIAFMRGKLTNTIVSKVALINDNLILNEINSEKEYEYYLRIFEHYEQDSPIRETKRTDFSIYTELRRERQLRRMVSRSYHFADDIAGTGSGGGNTETETERKSLRKKDRRYSKKDSEYLEAAESGDEETAGKLVEEAAKEWGTYSADGKTPLKLYHGTTSFGFTEFDLQKMDDKRSNADCLKKGRTIFYAKKSDILERVVVVTPIAIYNKPYYMGVMLHGTPDINSLYIHNVVIEKEINLIHGTSITDEGVETDNYLFLTMILLNAIKVKQNDKKIS